MAAKKGKKTEKKENINPAVNQPKKELVIQGKKFIMKPVKLRQLKIIRAVLQDVQEKITGESSLMDIIEALLDSGKIGEFLSAIFMGEEDFKNINTDELELNEIVEIMESFFLSNKRAIDGLMRLLGSSLLLNTMK